jgi:hypothetical protein
LAGFFISKIAAKKLIGKLENLYVAATGILKHDRKMRVK